MSVTFTPVHRTFSLSLTSLQMFLSAPFFSPAVLLLLCFPYLLYSSNNVLKHYLHLFIHLCFLPIKFPSADGWNPFFLYTHCSIEFSSFAWFVPCLAINFCYSCSRFFLHSSMLASFSHSISLYLIASSFACIPRRIMLYSYFLLSSFLLPLKLSLPIYSLFFPDLLHCCFHMNSFAVSRYYSHNPGLFSPKSLLAFLSISSNFPLL